MRKFTNAATKIVEYKEKLKQIKKSEEEPISAEVAKRREKEWENFRKAHGDDHAKVYSYVRSAVSRLVVVEARNTDIDPFASGVVPFRVVRRIQYGGRCDR